MNETELTWRISTYSGSSGTCVALAQLPDRRVLVRNSNAPEAGTVALTPAELSAWLEGCRAGALDTTAAD